jgi:hypothetical protein
MIGEFLWRIFVRTMMGQVILHSKCTECSKIAHTLCRTCNKLYCRLHEDPYRFHSRLPAFASLSGDVLAQFKKGRSY